MARQPQRYFAFLLRLWRTTGDGQATWQASLESPGTGECRGFARLEDLVAFLHAEMERAEDQENRENWENHGTH
jgi:hypothetical protein